MRLIYKLILGFSVIVLLILVVGFFAVYTSQKALQTSIGNSSTVMAHDALDKIDRNTRDRIIELQAYTKTALVQDLTVKSNSEFGKLDDIQEYINKKDREWVSASDDEMTPFMKALLSNAFSRDLKRKMTFHKEKCGFEVFGEIFATNKYGANIAQSGRTSDYRQDDEEWWQRAKEYGHYVTDIGYDKSAGVYSVDISVRIDDENGNFLGVLKAVLNIKEVIMMMKTMEKESFEHYRVHAHFKLLTEDGRIIYSSEDDFKMLEKLPDNLMSRINTGEKSRNYFIRQVQNEGKILLAFTRSKGYRDFKGHGWILVAELNTEEIFTPVVKLRNSLLIALIMSILIAVLLSLFISNSIFNPLTELKNAAVEVGKGNLDTPILVRSDDEVGQLAHSFKKMTRNLRETTTSIDNLNKEINERIKVEEALKRSNEFSRIILDSMNDAISIIDVHNFRIVECNSFFLKKFGLKKEEVIGRTCYETTHNRSSPCTPPDNACPLKDTMATGGHSTAEHIHVNKAGKKIYVEISVYPIKNEAGKVVQVVHVSRDITERKMTEEALALQAQELVRSNTELQQFAYVASHDLQEPLRMVTSYVQLLEKRYKDKLDSEAKEFIDFAVDGSQRMQKLINALLTLSRVGTHGKTFETTDCEAILKQVLASLQPAIRGNKAEVTHDPLPKVMADDVQLAQLFQNLIGNAIKFHGNDLPRVHISARKENNYWVFSVHDNGIGIEQKDADKVFQIFKRLHSRDEYPGAGIGLAVCRKIVERHGGRIWIESEPGKGSTFYFTIPIKKQGEGRETSDERKEEMHRV